MRTTEAIRAAIADLPAGSVFAVADFLSFGSRMAVDQALFRLVKAGQIKRVARGLYARAQDTGMEGTALALAVAQQSGQKAVVKAHQPTSGHTLVLTSGRTRSLVVGEHKVEFRRASQRKLELAQTPQGQVLLDLWSRGQKGLTTLEIKKLTGHWNESDIDQFAALIPAWLRQAVKQSNAQRKSVKLGLSGAYDWSNPLIKDTVLIGKVLEKHNFEDVVRLCAHYGVPKVRRVLRQRPFGPLTKASVSRMLGNIRSAFGQSGGADHAQA